MLGLVLVFVSLNSALSFYFRVGIVKNLCRSLVVLKSLVVFDEQNQKDNQLKQRCFVKRKVIEKVYFCEEKK